MKVKSLLLLGSLMVFMFYNCQTNVYTQGANLYNFHCAGCHSEDGKGLRDLIPPIADADYVDTHWEEIPCIIRYGIEGKLIVNDKEYNQPMQKIKKLNNIEIANIMNYINKQWGYEKDYISPKEVDDYLLVCPRRTE